MIQPNYKELVQFNEEKMAKVNLFESHRMFADLYCLLPGQAQKPHSHGSNDKMYFVLEGTSTFLLGNEEHILGPGESCTAKAGVPHGVRNHTDQPSVLLVFMAPHPGLSAG